jgi:hypothetical protein
MPYKGKRKTISKLHPICRFPLAFQKSYISVCFHSTAAAQCKLLEGKTPPAAPRYVTKGKDTRSIQEVVGQSVGV